MSNRSFRWFAAPDRCARPAPAGDTRPGAFDDAAAAARRALSGERGGKPLGELASGRRRACILIGDAWSPAPYAPVIEGIIREVVAAGVRPSRVTVLIARGLRPPTLGLLPMRLYGEPTAGDYAIENAGLCPVPRAEDDSGQAHEDVRTAQRPFDPRWLDADLRIAVGALLPHTFVGWTGGADLICPGITGPAAPDAIRPGHGQAAEEHRKTVQKIAGGAPPSLSLYIVQQPFSDDAGREGSARVAILREEGGAGERFAEASGLAEAACSARAKPARDLILHPPDLKPGDAVLFALAAAARLSVWIEPRAGARVWLPVSDRDAADEAADMLAALQRGDAAGGAMADPWVAEPVARGIAALGDLGAALSVAFWPKPGDGDASSGGTEEEGRQGADEIVELPDWADVAPFPAGTADPFRGLPLYVADPWRIVPVS